MRRKEILLELLDKLQTSYSAKSIVALKARQVIESMGGHYVNDHIAFRSLGLPGFGIASISAPFLELGYQSIDSYHFEAKKLKAVHLEFPEDPTLPKIFISELMVERMSPVVQSFLRAHVRKVDSSFGRGVIGLDSVNLDHIDSIRHALAATFLHLDSTPWPWVSYEDYSMLKKESEYASWVAAFGNRVNHFTLAVHHSKVYENIHVINGAMQRVGIKLNDSGGLVKGSAEVKLEQSSTVADLVYWPFADNKLEVIPYAYIEFAYRFPKDPRQPKPWRHEDLYHGFEEMSADKIFESTYEDQTNKGKT
ncbi:MAG: DUF1338 domain-containing protein [Acidobacteriota bacterium]|nr:DUF1338 domain-containing protein [Acidobacteriota bacterium]